MKQKSKFRFCCNFNILNVCTIDVKNHGRYNFVAMIYEVYYILCLQVDGENGNIMHADMSLVLRYNSFSSYHARHSQCCMCIINGIA